MKKIAFIAGPALGHVGRLINIAKSISSTGNAEIHCISPDLDGYAKTLFGPIFKTFLITIKNGDFLQKAESFGLATTKILDDNKYDLIVYDGNPLLWLTLVDFKGVPTVCITNTFLTQYSLDTPSQEALFTRHKNRINKYRTKYHLTELKSCYELYEADLVLLADPTCIVELLISELPNNYRQVGACVWESNQDFPKALEQCHDILLLSMGSTGPFSIDQTVFGALKRLVQSKTTVYAGNRADSLRQSIELDMDFEWLPLGEVLKRTKAVLSQGGVGSTYQALQMGVPTFILPGHKNHQIFGELITRLGVGMCIGEETSSHSLSKFNFVDMQSAAIELSKQMKKENGVKKAALSILELLNI